MKTYQFSVCVRIETGELVKVNGLITPPVTAETKTMAIYHKDTRDYCEKYKVTVYEVVR